MIKSFIIIPLSLIIFTALKSMGQPPLPGRLLTLEERAKRQETRRAEAKLYGDNIIRIFPLRAIDEQGIGLGVDYEHIFGANKNIGIVLPLSVSFFANRYGTSSTYAKNAFLYFSPGIKVYPFGQRKITYALGPNLFLGYGKANNYYFYLNNVSTPNRIRLGILVNNYLNIQLTPAVNFGVELGLGVRYLDKALNSPIPEKYRIGAAANFAVSFGYRF